MVNERATNYGRFLKQNKKIINWQFYKILAHHRKEQYSPSNADQFRINLKLKKYGQSSAVTI